MTIAGTFSVAANKWKSIMGICEYTHVSLFAEGMKYKGTIIKKNKWAIVKN